MKFFFPMIALAAFASAAQAGSALVELRTDLDSESYNSAAAKQSKSAFKFQTARVDFKGEINESLSYRARLKFNDESVKDGADKMSSRVDQAYLAHKMEALTLTVGKFGTDVGGWETATDAFYLYSGSEANKALTSTYAGTNGTFFRPVKYDTGAKVSYKFSDQELTVMALNNPAVEDVTGAGSQQSRAFTGVVYKGKFADGKLLPLLSYHSGGYSSDDVTGAGANSITGEGTSQLAAAGLKWNDGGWWAQLDYVDLKSAEFKPTDVTTMKVQSIVGEFALIRDEWTIKPKIESSTVTETPTVAAEGKAKSEGVALAAEYKPFADKNFRYHVAATQKTTKVDGIDDKIEQHLIFGVAFSADVLK